MIKLYREVASDFRGGDSNYLYNVVIEDNQCTLRVWLPLNIFSIQFNVSSYTPQEVSKKTLISSKKLFSGNRCNFNDNTIIMYHHNEIEYCLTYETSISLDVLKNLGSWHDNCVCTVVIPILSRVFAYPGILGEATAFSWFKTFSSSASLENILSFFSRLLKYEPILKFIALDSEKTSLSTSTIIFRLPSGAPLISNIPSQIFESSGEEIQKYLPRYEVSTVESVAPNASIKLDVSSFLESQELSSNCSITINMLSGYSAKSELKLVNGKGSFTVRALDLNPGDNLEIQLIDHGRVCKEIKIPVINQ